MIGLRSIFPALSAAGFYLLWVIMLQNGTIDALDLATGSGVFPTGRPLKTSYLGIPPIDGAISTLVGFTDALTNGADPGAKLLMIDVVSSLQTATLWVLIESLREKRSLFLSALWPIMWNAFGAGLVMPIYYLVQLNSNPNKNAKIAVQHAKALTATAALGLILPSLYTLLPPLVNRTPEVHQIITAVFQTTPVVAAALQYLFAACMSPKVSESASHQDPDVSFLLRSYIFTATFSGVAHIYVLATSLLSSDPLCVFSRLYIPAGSNVHPGTSETIFEGTMLFLQYDWSIINISTVLWMYISLEPYLNLSNVFEKLFAIIYMIIGVFLLGPGACGSIAFLWREEKLRRVNSTSINGSRK